MFSMHCLSRIIGLLVVGQGLAAERFDVAVFSATPAGIMASVQAARQGRTVALIEPTNRIGGLTTSGLSYTDFRTLESVTGAFREYMDRVLAYYTEKYGADSPQVRDCFFGALAEPHVSLHVFHEMLRGQPRNTLITEGALQDVLTRGGQQKTIRSIAVRTPSRLTVVEASVFIDASYEGDLAAAAGAPYRVGRESTQEFGERLAGHIFFKDGRLLQGSTGLADKRVQGYNFRIIMTRRPELKVMVS
jgi:flavin-dependent dehydrogenase